MKNNFIQNEIWTLTFSAAFQRANIYKGNPSESEKRALKNKLRGLIEHVYLEQYEKPVEDHQHIKNIYGLSDFSKSFDNILNDGQLNFGVCQKILNLYLKYQWCLGHFPEPPHFPVDRRIQEILSIHPVVSWTQMNDDKDYMTVINKVRDLVDKKESIASYELQNFSRRNSI
ncbi:hypothetical protein LX77_02285 [Gelidibacter algens]|uniref:Uncharacterized protein n=1 Tax=Gelidibacter algens TaxID=49280 RepID=A0A1A7R3I1_9FLAO|nr:hypothetical protein [Gelidibacter algens]OBX26820.1 hypothetical protein A9996_03145 [Gelidibacter algens]RAJ22730.1 hypothetical protein LX77_02285 [Gelidibacter algens]